MYSRGSTSKTAVSEGKPATSTDDDVKDEHSTIQQSPQPTADMTSRPDGLYADVAPDSSPWQPADAASRPPDGHVVYADFASPTAVNGGGLYANVDRK